LFKNTNNNKVQSGLLLIIVIAAAILRLWNFWHLPFMHDEFSAIFRTQYKNFHDLILYGVKLNDSHPAGVQVFLYYLVKITGVSEPLLKLPFILSGTLSIWLVYKIAARWFNETTGLFTAAFMSVIQYTVFYSQLARPYSAGMFFTLLSVWYWTKIVFDEKTSKKIYLYFILATAASIYIHAFTLFFAILQFFTGLLFVKGRKLQGYLKAWIITGILYAPHIPIFAAQLQRGDIGGWLKAPSPQFLINFTKYVFQFNYGFLSIVLVITIYLSARYFNKGKKEVTFRIVATAWFLITFLTAYFYSVLRNPVLQYSTLYFVFPFITMVFFSFIKKLNLKLNITGVLIIMVSGISVLVYGRNHYFTMYHQGFDQIPANIKTDINKGKGLKTAVVLQSPDTRMFDYYLKKYGVDINYFNMKKGVGYDSLNSWLCNVKPDRIIYGAADYPPVFIIETLKDMFPYIEKEREWFNSLYLVLDKDKYGKPVSKTRKKIASITFNNSNKKGFYTMNRNGKYSPGIEVMLDTLLLNRNDVLNVSVTVCDTTAPGKVLLVFDMRNNKGKAFFWSGKKFKDFYCKNNSGCYTVHSAKRIQSLGKIAPSTILKCYVWKRDTSVVHIKSLTLYKSSVNPVEMGLFEKLAHE
jgi:uncharacterized membrane protein